MTAYPHPTRLLVALDCIIFGFDGESLKLLLIIRNFEPRRGQWSPMGGFLRDDEDLDDAARRILPDLTGLDSGTGHANGHDGWFYPTKAGQHWRTIRQYPGAEHLRHVIGFFSQLPWWQLVPDQKHDVLLSGYGEYTKPDYVTAAMTSDSTQMVAYLPQPGIVRVDMSRLKGPQVRVRWYDPRTGQYTEGGRMANRGVQKVESPLKEDWVLLTSE